MDLAAHALQSSRSRVLGVRPRQGRCLNRALSVDGGKPRFDVVVVGGGFAGLAAVAQLANAQRRGRSLRLLLVEQGRGFGGRVCTRRRETEHGALSFDHGCQFFTPKVSQPHFADACRAWHEAGVAGAWRASIGTLSCRGATPQQAAFEPFDPSKQFLVGIPSMSAIGKHIVREATESASELQACTSSKASDASWDAAEKVWTVCVNADTVKSSVLAVATSARSCVRILGDDCPSGREASQVESNVCWALLVAFSVPLSQMSWDAVLLQGSSCFAWASRNSSKPGRPSSPECWVLHSCPEWSNPRAELAKEEVRKLLLAEFCDQFRCQIQEVVYAEAFRWNNAYPLNPRQLPDKCVVEPTRNLVAGGDWAAGDRVGDAFESGVAIAKAAISMVDA